MDLKKDANRIEIMDRVIGLLKDRFAENSFKLMIDRIGMQQIYLADPPEFFEFADGGMRYKNVVIVRNDYCDGVWVQFH